ncbi:hypothetical protein KSZ_51410 [Dictyobacter formicarum]|uniref:Uncharacterized protein n=1 Tax=Dictyobacter formicarum TaxID=2778368 RepID=A0ABQ3VMW7_9CHLR|nr:hypothetical protein KSZ_51410 [Dictyobacter formicarum]
MQMSQWDALSTKNILGNGWRAGYQEIGPSGSEEDTQKPDMKQVKALCVYPIKR